MKTTDQRAARSKDYTAILIGAIIAAAIAIAGPCSGQTAQTLKRDGNGNYVAQPREAIAQRDSVTTLTYTDAKGIVWPVYIGAKGGHYVARISKKGTYYRQYLKD